MNPFSRQLTLLRTTVLVILASHPAVHGGLRIIDAGQPRATIVVPDKPSEQTTQAAAFLQTYLRKISGAEVQIQPETHPVQGIRILVGPGRSVTELGVEVPSGITYQMSEEGFVSKTIGNDFVLAGNEDGHYRGTMYAVSDFLDELGCRWFFPGEYGEVVPHLATIDVESRDRVERPDFRFRNIWFAGGYPFSREDAALIPDWYDRNRISPLEMSLPADGTVTRLAPPEMYFESHPHIFALKKDGTRSREMMCMSEEDSVRIAAQTIDRYFQEHPDAYTFGFAPPDGFPTCYCSKCQDYFPGFTGKGYGDPSTSEVWFQFANQVAREVYRKHPDRWVMTNGYSNRVRPPEGTGPLSPNLGIQSAVISACSLHRIGDPDCWQRRLYQQVLDRWAAAVDCLFIYDYEPGHSLANLPFPSLHNLPHDMRYFKSRGIWGFWTESGNAWMVTHLNCYVRGKLMWDVNEDVHELVRDYCEKFYEDAASPVEEYMWTLEEAVEKTHLHVTWGRLMRWEIILADCQKKLDRLVAQAEQLAVTPAAKERVHVLRLTHDHMNAYVAMEEAANEGRFAEAAELGRSMLVIRDKAEQIKSGLIPKTPEFRKSFRTTIEWQIDQYQDLADRADGVKGKLVLLLPRHWRFRRDPHDIGVLYQWYNDTADEAWEEIDTTLYWEAQGHVDEDGWGYTGKAWYQTEFNVPAEAEGKPLLLTIGAVYNRGVWLWVNGQMVNFKLNRHKRLGHHDVRSPIHVDITPYLRSNQQNRIAVLVHTNEPGRNPRGGIHRRAFLWSPREH